MSLKYLLPALQSRPGSVGMPDREFEKLLLDVQVGRTNNRSQEEFIESLERIINELKAHSAEAEPFLKPVSKKIAPDYDQVISKPMDLGTLLKNVKNRMYKTKKSFARDLNLIWTNCLTYNSVEGHPLRQQALFMKRLADHHLSYLADRASESASLPSFLTANTHPGQTFRQGRSASFLERAGLPSPGNTHAQLEEAPSKGTMATDGTEGVTAEDKHDPGSPEPSGAPYNSLPNDISDTPAIFRTQKAMQAYQTLLEKDADGDSADHLLKGNYGVPSWYPQQQQRGSRSGSRSRSATPSKEDAPPEKLRGNDGLGIWWGEFSQPQWIGSGFPISSLEGTQEKAIAIENSGRRGHKRKKNQPAKPSTRDPDMPGGFMQDAVARNIENLSRLRIEAQRLSSHVAALHDDTAAPTSLPEINLDDDFTAEELLVRKKPRLEGSEHISEVVASQQMRFSVGALMGQTGFSGCSQLAIDSISELAGRYLRHLGKTFRLLLDRNDPAIAPEELILLALRENGDLTPEILSTHVTDDVFKQNQKVEDILSKVRQAMAAQPELEAMEEEVDEKDMTFGIPGMEDLGDFLGIPGIPAIPRKLLRPPPGIREADKVKIDTPTLEYQPPPPFVPLSATDIPFQIGLLRTFYVDKLGDAEELPEDDFDPNLPPMGAMGQVNVKTVSAATKRKAEAAAATAGGVDANKKKSKFLPSGKT